MIQHLFSEYTRVLLYSKMFLGYRYLWRLCTYYTNSAHEILEHLHYKGKGRPKKNDISSKVTYQIIIKFQQDDDGVKRLREADECYVIGTNTNEEQLTTPEVIDAYRKQHHA